MRDGKTPNRNNNDVGIDRVSVSLNIVFRIIMNIAADNAANGIHLVSALTINKNEKTHPNYDRLVVETFDETNRFKISFK